MKGKKKSKGDIAPSSSSSAAPSSTPSYRPAELNIDDLIELSDRRAYDGHDNGGEMMQEQKDLVEEAFASLDVLSEFQKEKEKVIKEENNEKDDEEVTLPGWGSWVGFGVTAVQRKPKEKENKQRIKRDDDKKDHVIIYSHQKKDKKAAKYMVPKLPKDFTNKAHFEKTLEQPLGSDWNSLRTHSSLSKPKVVTTAGALITPIEKKITKKTNKANKSNKTSPRKLPKNLHLSK